MGADAAAVEHFGPYLVYERLGVGGMATVHRAVERDAGGGERIVALKRLLPHLAADASFIKAFVREAKLASLLAHVNIVEIYELGRVGHEYFISMEYIDGHDLRRVLRHARKVTGPPPIHITVGLMLQLCDALDYAHNRVDEDGHALGLVHRDVSPSNLLVTTTGHLKVIDFGIAKAQSSQHRTQTGRVKGKLAYMAPEAVSGGRDLDARSDVWAAGVILHELLTARPLFGSKNEYETLVKVQRSDIKPPSTFNQTCPPELDAIVFKALERDPDQRFGGADKLRAALDEMRRRYQLQSSVRDVAGWIEWAFSLDMPAGFSGNTLEPSISRVRARTPPPVRNREDDEAVEMVWGSGEADRATPLPLDDVPDVSKKHLPRPDTEDSLDDDIPTPQPSHGLALRQPRPSQPAEPADPPNVSDRLVTQRVRARRSAAVVLEDDLRADTFKTDPDGRAAPSTDPMARSLSDSDSTAPPVSKLSADELFGADEHEHDDDVAATIVATPETRDAARDAREARDAPDTINTSRDRPITPPAPLPRVRFSTAPPMSMRPFEAGGLAPLRPPPQTKPGVQPASAYVRAPKPSGPIIGAAIIEREGKPSRRGWMVLAGLVILGAAATGVTLVLTTGEEPLPPTPSAPVRELGTVKFVIEPADAEIEIEGQRHTGSPWSTELPAGVHQIEIHRSTYKGWITSTELSAKETQTFRVVLEPLGAAAVGDATLSVSTTPAGLDVVLDGAVLPNKTPIKVDNLKPGSHTIALRRDGLDIWHQTINAEPSSDYELNPSFTPAKQRERAQRTDFGPRVGSRPPKQPPVEPAPAPELNDPEAPPPPPDDAALTDDLGTVHALDAAVASPTTGPQLVVPTAVTKLTGEPPNIAKLQELQDDELPPTISAKVCIDALGVVASVELVTKIDPHAAQAIVDAIQSWRYAPYKKAGVALSVCFVVALRK